MCGTREKDKAPIGEPSLIWAIAPDRENTETRKAVEQRKANPSFPRNASWPLPLSLVGRSSSHVGTSNRNCVALGCLGLAESVLAAALRAGQRAAQSDEPAKDCHPASAGERDRLPEEERHIGRLLHRRPEWQHVGAHQQEGGPGKASVPHGKRLRAPVSRIEDARREERAEPE